MHPNLPRHFFRLCASLRFVLLAIAMGVTGSDGALSAELVLVAADSPPTAYMERGKPTGILVDIVTEAFRRAGYPIEIRLMPWARCLVEARSGQVDGIFSLFKKPEREKYFSYTSVPIITQVEAFFVRANSDLSFDGDIAKLRKLRIGTIYGTSYGPVIDRSLQTRMWSKIEETSSTTSLVEMLVAERFDLAVGYRHVVLEAAIKKGLQGRIRELSPSIDEIPSYLAFNRQRSYAAAIADFDRALLSMKNDRSFDAIYKKYGHIEKPTRQAERGEIR